MDELKIEGFTKTEPYAIERELGFSRGDTIDEQILADGLQNLRNARVFYELVGLRFILPKIYRFVTRLDYAKNTLRKDDLPISFGVQQFF